jgi:hypothetical protein
MKRDPITRHTYGYEPVCQDCVSPREWRNAKKLP